MIINFYDGGPSEEVIVFPDFSFSDEQPRDVPLVEEFFLPGYGGGTAQITVQAPDFFDGSS